MAVRVAEATAEGMAEAVTAVAMVVVMAAAMAAGTEAAEKEVATEVAARVEVMVALHIDDRSQCSRYPGDILAAARRAAAQTLGRRPRTARFSQGSGH